MFRAVLGLFQGLNAVSGVDDVEDTPLGVSLGVSLGESRFASQLNSF